MHLIIYGSESDGKFTVNADGTRVEIKRGGDGAWAATSPAALLEAMGKVREAGAASLLSRLAGALK